MAKIKSEQLDPDDLVYYTHPSGKVQEMTRAEAAKLEKKEGGEVDPDLNPGEPAK
jgi:hypothetical protein